MTTSQNACDTPLCDTISKGYCAIWGGVSRTGPLSLWPNGVAFHKTKLFVAPNDPVRGRFLALKSPTKVYVGPFLAFFPRKWGTQTFFAGALLWRPRWLHTQIFTIWELFSKLHRTSVTQGLLAGILLCNWAPPQRTFCARANYTHYLSGN